MTDEPMDPQEWWERVDEVVGGLDPLTEDEQRLLLDVASVAAHTSQRWTAPLTTYRLGVVLAAIPPEERAGRLADWLAALQPPEDGA